jgi:hypothetical protein
MAHEPRVVLVHGGHRIEAAVVAHWTSCSQTVQATAAHRKLGKTKKSSPGFGSDLHRSLYGSEEVARWQWSFGFRWRWCEHDEDQEEATFYGAEASRGRAGVPSWPVLTGLQRPIFKALVTGGLKRGEGAIQWGK